MANYQKLDVTGKVTRVVNLSDKKIIPFKNQIYENLKNECLKSGKLFEDPVFPASDRSIFYNQSIPPGTTWKRPNQISTKPLFVDGIADANDLDQGFLGDCWFIAGCAAITLIPELFDNVVPSGQQIEGPQYAGIFHFRFWYYGQWVDVVIDDRLPVNSSNKLIFCSNRQEPNEFWAALLEKAYAKLSGAYENLDGGNTTDALIDMTGGIEESFEIKDMRTTAQKNEIWDVLIKSRKHKSLIGASIAPNPRIREARLTNGLVMGHAYTVTKIACIEVGSREVRLVRVRNPWGNEVEWKGAWSDNSTLWNSLSEDVKTELKYKHLPDGQFWISYDDFYSNFETVQFCELTPDAFSAELLKKQDPTKAPKLYWKLTAYNGEWAPGKSSGGSGRGNEALYWTNPQFLVTLTDYDPDDKENMATIIIALMQKYTREERINNNGESCEQFIQFRLYRVLNQKDADMAKKTGQRLYANQLEKCGVSGPYINLREVTKRFRTAPGTYLIVPSCYDSNVKGEFLIRLYTESPISENQISILDEHKPNLDSSDIFFNNPKSIDDAFSSWSNLIGGGSSKSSSSDYNKSSDYGRTQTARNTREIGRSGSFGYVAPSSLYVSDTYIDVYEKVDTKKI